MHVFSITNDPDELPLKRIGITSPFTGHWLQSLKVTSLTSISYSFVSLNTVSTKFSIKVFSIITFPDVHTLVFLSVGVYEDGDPAK